MDTFSLSYDSDYWEEGIYDGKPVLNSKNKEGYLTYLVSNKEANVMESLKSQANRKEVKSQLDATLEMAENTTILYSNWEVVSDNLYVFKIKSMVTGDGYEGYMNHYWYILNDYIYIFTTVQKHSDDTFNSDVEEVLNTIVDNN